MAAGDWRPGQDSWRPDRGWRPGDKPPEAPDPERVGRIRAGLEALGVTLPGKFGKGGLLAAVGAALVEELTRAEREHAEAEAAEEDSSDSARFAAEAPPAYVGLATAPPGDRLGRIRAGLAALGVETDVVGERDLLYEVAGALQRELEKKDDRDDEPPDPAAEGQWAGDGGQAAAAEASAPFAPAEMSLHTLSTAAPAVKRAGAGRAWVTAVPLGTHWAPQGPVMATPQRVRHWHDTVTRLLAHGIKPPVTWDHREGALPVQPGERPDPRYTAGYVVGSRVNAENGFDLCVAVPGAEVDEDGHLVSDVVLPDGTRRKSAVKEVSIGIKDWTDGQLRLWRDAPIHLALCHYPVVAGQKGFRRA